MKNQKKLIRLVVPYASQEFDVFVPEELPAAEVVILINQAVSSLAGQKTGPDENRLLCSERLQKVLRGDRNLKDYGIRNGDRMFLL